MGQHYDYRKLGAGRPYRMALRVSPWEQVRSLVERYLARPVKMRHGLIGGDDMHSEP